MFVRDGSIEERRLMLVRPRASLRTPWAVRLNRRGPGRFRKGRRLRKPPTCASLGVGFMRWRDTIAVKRRWSIGEMRIAYPRSTRSVPTHCLPMPKSRGRKPKKKRAPASAPKKRLDNFNTTPQELPLSTQPPQEPPLATAPRQEQPTPKIKKIAKLITAVVLAAIAIVLCAYAFILTKQ